MTVVGNRYARALIDVLPPERAASGLDQLQRIAALLDEEPDARKLLMNPIVSPDRRQALLSEIGGALALDAPLRKLLTLLVERRRLGALDDLIHAYQKLLDERQGIVRAEVTAAAELSEAEQRAIVEKLERSTGKRVFMEIRQDPSLIGGLVVRMGSTVLDGSLRQQLSSFRQRMLAGGSLS